MSLVADAVDGARVDLRRRRLRAGLRADRVAEANMTMLTTNRISEITIGPWLMSRRSAPGQRANLRAGQPLARHEGGGQNLDAAPVAGERLLGANVQAPQEIRRVVSDGGCRCPG